MGLLAGVWLDLPTHGKQLVSAGEMPRGFHAQLASPRIHITEDIKMPYWRSRGENVYHFCMRCGLRQPLAQMVWQRGLLVCKSTNCIDRWVVGFRELAVAKALAGIANTTEAQPVQKLTEPALAADDEEQITF